MKYLLQPETPALPTVSGWPKRRACWPASQFREMTASSSWVGEIRSKWTPRRRTWSANTRRPSWNQNRSAPAPVYDPRWSAKETPCRTSAPPSACSCSATTPKTWTISLPFPPWVWSRAWNEPPAVIIPSSLLRRKFTWNTSRPACFDLWPPSPRSRTVSWRSLSGSQPGDTPPAVSQLWNPTASRRLWSYI